MMQLCISLAACSLLFETTSLSRNKTNLSANMAVKVFGGLLFVSRHSVRETHVRIESITLSASGVASGTDRRRRRRQLATEGLALRTRQEPSRPRAWRG